METKKQSRHVRDKDERFKADLDYKSISRDFNITQSSA